ncbi:MAG TPA: hypothetical protein VIL63_12090 [Terriglobales bacterium]
MAGLIRSARAVVLACVDALEMLVKQTPNQHFMVQLIPLNSEFHVWTGRAVPIKNQVIRR